MFKPTLFAAAAIAVAAPATAQAPDLQAVRQHLAAVTTMTAAFSQTDRNGKVLTGVLSLKKPGKLRFQYEKGVPILVVADGNSLYFVDYSVRQVERWPIGNSPLAVLLDPRKDVTGIAKVIPSASPDVVSVEVRDPKNPQFGRITMIFARSPGAPGGLMMQGWVALDSQNNRTTIRLSNQRFNGAIADAAFRWTDPRRRGPRS